MKVIINNIIPFKGYKAMTLYPYIFARGKLSDKTINHENIHGEQQKELLIILFLLFYLIEYLIKLLITFNHNKAYHSISFEQEARYNENDYNYLKNRKSYIWIKYVFKLWKL